MRFKNEEKTRKKQYKSNMASREIPEGNSEFFFLVGTSTVYNQIFIDFASRDDPITKHCYHKVSLIIW